MDDPLPWYLMGVVLNSWAAGGGKDGKRRDPLTGNRLMTTDLGEPVGLSGVD